MEHNSFYLFAAILGVAVVSGLIANKLKQPVVVAFIGVGVGVGPVGTGWVEVGDQIELFAQLGIAILLFLVGLKLDIRIIKSSGLVALATGLGQIVVTAIFGLTIALFFGFEIFEAIYIAAAISFSSTIIIVKLLSDKRELDQLHGRISIGVLIVQDIVVIAVMIGLVAFSKDNGASLFDQIVLTLGKGIALVGGLMLVSKYVLVPTLNLAARSRELLVLFAVAFAVGFASLTDFLGFSTEIGAFLAGVAIASTQYQKTIGSKLVNLRDFLLLFFFLDLGARLEFGDISGQLIPAIILSIFVLVGKPVIVMAIMGRLRYPSSVSTITGLTLAQISEFSLILAALGLSLGHIDSSTFSVITLIGLITISISSYLILYSHRIYKKFGSFFTRFERANIRKFDELLKDDFDIVIYGYGRYGKEIAHNLHDKGFKILVIDHDPQISADRYENMTTLFGEVEDLDLLSSLSLEKIQCVVSTIPHIDVNIALSKELKHNDFKGVVAQTAHHRKDVKVLEDLGVELILEPFIVAAQSVADAIHSHARVASPVSKTTG